MRYSSQRRQAFTLIELLVVIAIIAVLIALLVPAVQKVRYVAARTQSTNNLKQCALASHSYCDAWKCLPFNGVASALSTDNTSGSWAYQVLPYVDQQPLYDSQPANVKDFILRAPRARAHFAWFRFVAEHAG
jgi:prepilin-type N-terminal cleavage/methylation domain-containing protein